MWTVDDALRVTASIVDGLTTGDAQRLSKSQVWSIPANIDPTELSDRAAASNAALRNAILDQDPIWCDPHMVDLLAVATAQMPRADALEPWHLPYPYAGIVLFAKPLPTEWQSAVDDHGAEHDVTDKISAITWESPNMDTWVVRAWVRTTGTGPYELKGGARIRLPDLCPSPVVEVIQRESSVPSPLGRVLVALTALSRTTRSVGESREQGSKAARLRARRAKMLDPRVRRLYLHRPESGPAELEAFRAQRNGSPRGHWVRGHGRQ